MHYNLPKQLAQALHSARQFHAGISYEQQLKNLQLHYHLLKDQEVLVLLISRILESFEHYISTNWYQFLNHDKFLTMKIKKFKNKLPSHPLLSIAQHFLMPQ